MLLFFAEILIVPSVLYIFVVSVVSFISWCYRFIRVDGVPVPVCVETDNLISDWCTVKRTNIPFVVMTVCPNGHPGVHYLERAGGDQVARTCRECGARWAEVP